MLDDCDIDRLLPYYFFHYRKACKARIEAMNPKEKDMNGDESNIVVRNGKKYRKVKAGQASWADKIF